MSAKICAPSCATCTRSDALRRSPSAPAPPQPLSPRHLVTPIILSLHHSVTPSLHHPATLSLRHPITLSPYRPVTLPPCHPATLPPCHPVTLTLRPPTQAIDGFQGPHLGARLATKVCCVGSFAFTPDPMQPLGGTEIGIDLLIAPSLHQNSSGRTSLQRSPTSVGQSSAVGLAWPRTAQRFTQAASATLGHDASRHPCRR